MKQVININFHGQVVPIEVSAFDLLKKYTESLSHFFANEDGKEEIINDIESRIAELFQERLKKGATCITDDDVNAIISSMGRPEDFETEEETTSSKSTTDNENTTQAQPAGTNFHKRLFRDENDKVLGGVCSGLANYFGLDPILIRIIFLVIGLAFGTGILAYIILWIAVPSSASAEIGGARKKLFRDPEDKIVAGVCSGIGNYFGVSAWLPRVLFLLPFLSFALKWSHFGIWDFPDFLKFSFSPGSLMVYIILWLVIPEAVTTAEKLAMKGEKVDLNSIKNSVIEEMKGVQGRAEKLGAEAKTFAQEKGKNIGMEIGAVAKKSSKSLGDIILIIIKAFAYFIIGCVSFALVVALFGIAIFSIGIFPLKDFLLTNGWQNAFAWGTLLFFIAVPVIGVITWIIRRLAKMKGNSRIIRFSFISLWVIGWACFIMLVSSLSKDFRTTNSPAEQELVLNNPTVSRLEFTGHDDLINHNLKNRWFKLEPFANFSDDDTFYVNNVHFRIVKSLNDSFKVTILKMANGSSRKNADSLAALIEYNIIQKDSLVTMPMGIPIIKKDKFRNQHVVITVSVPVGKQIRINQSIWNSPTGRVNFSGDFEDWDDYWGNEERGWTTNVDYIMKTDGLYTLDGTPANGNGRRRNQVRINKNGIEVQDENNNIHIDKNGISIDENKQEEIDRKIEQMEDRQEQVKDSLNKILDKKLEEEKQKLLKEAAQQNAFSSPIGLPIINSLM